MQGKEEILDIVGPQPLPVFPWSTVAIGAGIVLVVAIVGWIVWKATRPTPPAMPTARATALARLREIRNRIGAIDGYQLSILASDVLRNFFSATLRIPATQQTSPEFLASLQDRLDVSPDQRLRIGNFLARVDAAKFAHELPSDSELENLLDHAVEIVDGPALVTP